MKKPAHAIDLSTVPSLLLLKEIARRLHPDTFNTSELEAQMDQAKNETRRGIARRLSEGKRPRQATELIRFLLKKGTAQTMTNICDHMRKCGYKSRTFYDLSNALVDEGFAEVDHVGSEKAWRVTPVGHKLLNEG